MLTLACAAQIVGNICTMACGDPAATPNASAPEKSSSEEPPPEARHASATGEAAPSPEAIARAGAEAALQHFATHFGAGLLEALPKLWECMTGALLAGGAAEAQSLVNNLQVRLTCAAAILVVPRVPWRYRLAKLPRPLVLAHLKSSCAQPTTIYISSYFPSACCFPYKSLLSASTVYGCNSALPRASTCMLHLVSHGTLRHPRLLHLAVFPPDSCPATAWPATGSDLAPSPPRRLVCGFCVSHAAW